MHDEMYCEDPDHECHTDSVYHASVTEFDPEHVDEDDLAAARSFFGFDGEEEAQAA